MGKYNKIASKVQRLASEYAANQLHFLGLLTNIIVSQKIDYGVGQRGQSGGRTEKLTNRGAYFKYE